MADLIEREPLLAKMWPNGNKRLVEEAPAVNRWIPVEDALPDEFIYVICGGKDGMEILRYNGEVWVDDAGCIYPMPAITHWMPLPEPPEKE